MHRLCLMLALMATGPAFADVRINEVDASQSSVDNHEFVELYDGGAGNTPLDGYVLVWYNGASDTAYAVFDLSGEVSGPEGYFLVGNAALVPAPDIETSDSSLQNGTDAVALFQADAEDFIVGDAVRTEGLVDAVVYGAEYDAALAVLLLSGEGVAQETGEGEVSLQRCPNGEGLRRSTSAFYVDEPTPGAANLCPEGLPIADFDYAPAVVYAGDAVNFTNLSTGEGITSAWEFTGGAPDTSIEDSPQGVVFAQPGDARVRLLVVGTGGLDDAEVIIPVLEPTPSVRGAVASAIAATACYTVTFSAEAAGKPPLNVGWEVLDAADAVVASGAGETFAWEVPADIAPGVYRGRVTVASELGNAQEETATFAVSNEPRAVSVATLAGAATNVSPITVIIAFDAQAIAALSHTALELTNASVVGWEPSLDLPQVEALISFSDEGPATVRLPAGAALLDCGVPNAASDTLEILYDSIPPVVEAFSTVGDSSEALLPFFVTVSETTTELTDADFEVSGGAVVGLVASAEGYSGTMLAVVPGGVSLRVRENAVTDSAGNGNAVSNVVLWNYQPIEEGEGEPATRHSADLDNDKSIELDELLRVIQLFNAREFHCNALTEDGYALGEGPRECGRHSTDYAEPAWRIGLSEILRTVQLFALGPYVACEDSEDGFCSAGR